MLFFDFQGNGLNFFETYCEQWILAFNIRTGRMTRLTSVGIGASPDKQYSLAPVVSELGFLPL